MIIKLDHVSYSCAISDVEKVRNTFRPYNVVFRQKAENLGIKAALCSKFSAGHELMLLSPQDSGRLPIEITAYDEVFMQDQRLWIDANTIHIKTNTITDTEDFFKALGFEKESENELFLQGIFEPKKVHIKLHETTTVNAWKLDSEGWNCLAFLCDSAERQRAKLMSKINCTPIEKLIINGRQLKIFFAQGIQGELVEFFSL